jgi:hypothetical protein
VLVDVHDNDPPSGDAIPIVSHPGTPHLPEPPERPDR